MKKYALLTAAAAILALTACNSNETPTTNGPLEIKLKSGLVTQTRAAHGLDTQLAASEVVHVWIDDAGNAENLYADCALTADAGGNLSGAPMYFPSTGNAVDIYAVHGTFATTDLPEFWSTSAVHTVASNQLSAGGGYAASDLVYSKTTGVARTSSAVCLEFKHLLSKLEVVLVSGAGAPSIAKVEVINTRLQASLTPDKATDNFTVAATGATGENPIEIDNGVTAKSYADQADSDEGKVLNEAVIVPQSLGSGTPFIRVTTTQGGVLVYALEKATTFEPAKKYRYTITANLTGLTVSSTISAWGATPAETGEATMD